jgi:hypothetical protein
MALRQTNAKEITPIAWKKPLLMVNRGSENEPRSSGGTQKPWLTTVKTMMIMLARAKALAFASYLSPSAMRLSAQLPSDAPLKYLCTM